jgi:chorismate synthase
VTGDTVDKAHYERSDISVVPAAGVVAEAMVMLTLADAMLDMFGGSTIGDTREALDRYVARISAGVEAPVTGGRRGAASSTVSTGGDEAGSGGDD